MKSGEVLIKQRSASLVLLDAMGRADRIEQIALADTEFVEHGTRQGNAVGVAPFADFQWLVHGRHNL